MSVDRRYTTRQPLQYRHRRSHIFSPTFVMNGAVEYNRWTEGNDTQSFGSSLRRLVCLASSTRILRSFRRLASPSRLRSAGSNHRLRQASFANNVAPLLSTSTRRTKSTPFRSVYGSVIDIYGGRIAPTQFNFGNAMTSGPDPNNATTAGDAFASFIAGAGTTGSTGSNAFPASSYYLHGGTLKMIGRWLGN